MKLARWKGILGGLALAGACTGCVSLNEYEALERRAMEQAQVIEAADARVAALESENQELQSRTGEAEAAAESARQEAEAVRSQLAEARRQLEEEANRIISDISPASGFDGFDTNPDTGGIILEGDILFRSGRAELTSEGQALITRLCNELQAEQYEGYHVEVAGHTDSDPIQHSSWEDNWQLSAERARTVLLAMVGTGADESRFHLSGYGPHQARDTKSESRRVEIMLSER